MRLLTLLSASALIGAALLSASCSPRRSYAVTIPADAPSNTHCFFAAQWGVHVAIVVPKGKPVPLRVSLSHDYNTAYLASNAGDGTTGYGEIHLYPMHFESANQENTGLNEEECRRVPR